MPTCSGIGVRVGVFPTRDLASSKVCDRGMCGRCNGVERLFRRPKGFRLILPQFGKPDVIFLSASSCTSLSAMHRIGVNTPLGPVHANMIK